MATAHVHEFDLDAALAQRPALLLVDELAHTNAHGSSHTKRWQDIEELRNAGIDVWTTVNVQHLESLNDVVAGITQVRMQETVPDTVFESADEVELIDLPPDDLLQRLREGKVYVPERVRVALDNFFRKGNLIALRELALRKTPSGSTRQWTAIARPRASPRHGRPANEFWWASARAATARLGACGKAAGHALHAPWIVVYVETPNLIRLPEAERNRRIAWLQAGRNARRRDDDARRSDGRCRTVELCAYAQRDARAAR